MEKIKYYSFELIPRTDYVLELPKFQILSFLNKKSNTFVSVNLDIGTYAYADSQILNQKYAKIETKNSIDLCNSVFIHHCNLAYFSIVSLLKRGHINKLYDNSIFFSFNDFPYQSDAVAWNVCKQSSFQKSIKFLTRSFEQLKKDIENDNELINDLLYEIKPERLWNKSIVNTYETFGIIKPFSIE